jgi:DNA-binding transcriptional ArsR family regulator
MLRSKGNRDQQHAPVFFALGDATRLWLVGRLADGSSHSISELTEGSTLTRQAITKHLHVLEGAGLVRSIRIGRESRYEFEHEPIADMQAFLAQVSARWDVRLARLKALVEGD